MFVVFKEHNNFFSYKIIFDVLCLYLYMYSVGTQRVILAPEGELSSTVGGLSRNPLLTWHAQHYLPGGSSL